MLKRVSSGIEILTNSRAGSQDKTTIYSEAVANRLILNKSCYRSFHIIFHKNSNHGSTTGRTGPVPYEIFCATYALKFPSYSYKQQSCHL